ncbi:hypothetical protein GpartN1_g4569.t1 [Galdieria partita]|uniref:Cytochrome c oxidase subunit n=1 Tax=Galdieria partita TaxID=83374 RepID=A0A9C7PXK5_9RHOD|nr:hypothetical protein GpartN1_g4569.t1 [Galdieria partita]
MAEEGENENMEIKLETAPHDPRFQTTNQAKHCWSRYIEYHACVKQKGEEDSECQKFKRWYKSLCPNEWLENWDEQRANGTFPGPV